MKKRAVLPDTYTFTILLNGLASVSRRHPPAHERALELYNSMMNPNSPLEPQIIHTNSVLKVCARHGDVDSMWTIVSKLPLNGPNAPDAITYTTLLNGIREPRDVEDGMRVWAGILSRWSNGKLWVDEDLTCAMGRVLLMGEKPGYWKEVLNIVEQVFGIKQPSKGVEETPTEDLLYIGGTTKPVSQIYNLLEYTPTNAPVDPYAKISYVPPNLRGPSTKPDPSSGSNSSATRPRPGNNTLTLVLKACTLLDDSSLTTYYWKALTSPPHCIQPDIENYHEILRLLRRSRSGPEALDTLHSMCSRSETAPTAKSFFIAMSCCKRSGRGNSFATAEKMLELMKQLGIRIDVKILNMFLQCAIKAEDEMKAKSALKTVENHFDLEFELNKLTAQNAGEELLETHVELAKWIHGIIDVLLANPDARWGHGERSVFQAKKSGIQKLITKFGWIAGGAKGGGKNWKKGKLAPREF